MIPETLCRAPLALLQPRDQPNSRNAISSFTALHCHLTKRQGHQELYYGLVIDQILAYADRSAINVLNPQVLDEK